MTEVAERRHGLESFMAACPVEEGDVADMEIRLQPGLGHINLRGDPTNTGFVAAAESVLEQTLPVVPNTIGAGNRRIYWLGPDEWLVVCSVSEARNLIAELRESLSAQHASVTDVTGGQIAMQLSGSGAREVLCKGCTLDFRPRSFEVGSCAQSGLAKANVLIGLLDNQPTFQIIVRRSFAEYLALWLRHAAREYSIMISVE